MNYTQCECKEQKIVCNYTCTEVDTKQYTTQSKREREVTITHNFVPNSIRESSIGSGNISQSQIVKNFGLSEIMRFILPLVKYKQQFWDRILLLLQYFVLSHT